MAQMIKQRIADIQRGNIPAGYRKTKSGIIPDTWSCCQPKEIFSGKSIKNNDSELPVLSVTQENGVMLRSEMDKDISYKEDSVSSYKRVDIGDFVISLRSFEGGIEYSQCQGVVSPAYTIFSHSEDVDGNYYKYYFKTDFFINNLNTAVYGIRDGKQIGFQDFSNLFIHRPPQKEQRRIAEILGCCDRVIALKKELIAEKKKQKKALMQKLLNPDSGFRLPGFSGEWKKDVLGSFIDLISGVDFSTEDLLSDNSFTPYLTGASNIDNNTLILNRWVVDPKNIALKNDILVVCKGSGVGAMIIMPIQKAHIARQFMAIRVHPTSSNKYIYYILQNSFERIRNEAQGLIVGIDRGTILKLNVAMPDKEEQQAIADILSAADKEIDLLEQELAQQEQKKKSLMQLLLTGTVRV